MVALSTKPGKPDFRAGLGRDKRLLHLLGALDAAQWRKLGSAEGLGIDDLSPEQRPLFLDFLPDPFGLVKKRMREGNPREIPGEEPIAVDRSAVRMRLCRAIDLLLMGKDDERSNRSVRSLYPQPEGTELFEAARAGYEDMSPAAVFGRLLRRTIPSRPKPGDLPFDAPALSGSISLAGAATVGDLVARAQWPARGSYSIDLMARAQGKCILQNYTYRGDSKPGYPHYHNRPRGSRAIAVYLTRPLADWDGVVLDLSGMPVDTALPLLEGLAPAGQNPPDNAKKWLNYPYEPK
jgi:hypothetical protein